MADSYRRNIYDVMRDRERESRASAQANPLDVYREVLDAGGGKSDPLAVYRQVLEEKQQEEEQKKKGNALSRTVGAVVGTVEDVQGNLGLGAWRSIEGIVDFGAGIIGAGVGLVSRDGQQAVKRFIEKDYSGALFQKYMDIYESILNREYGEGSIQSPDGIAAEVEQAIGGMLPAVAVSIATSGAASGTMVSSLKGATGAAKAASAASKAAKVSKVASMATMATGAAGQSTQEAYRDGASYGRGLAYGALRGATEAGTEMLVGGVAGRVMGTGTGVFDDVLRSVARNKASRIALEAAGEGLEEVLSEAADPLTRSVYKGSEALNEYASPEFAGRLGKSFGVGALTSTVFGQTVGRATGQVGTEADVRELLSDVETLDKKRYNLDLREKLTAEADAKIEAQELEDYHEIEGILKKAAPEKRAGIIERLGLETKFSEDGTLREDFTASVARKFSRGVAAAEGESGVQDGSAGSAVPFERRMASVDADPEAVSRALSKTGRVQYAGELSETGKQNLKKLKSVMHRFSDLSRGALGQFVIADESVENDAYYDPETGYIVLGKDVLEREDGVKKSVSRAWFAAALHEVTHGVDNTVSGVFMEAALGTLENGKHYSRVFKELSNRGYLEGKASDIRRRIERYMEKQAKGQALTEKESAELNVFHSECAPLIAERVLNNEHFLRELIAEDASLVERLLGKLADLRESTSRVRDPEARAVIKEIRAIEETLLDAVAERGMAYRDRKLVMVNGEREEEEEIREMRNENPRSKFSEDKYFKKQMSKWSTLRHGSYVTVGKLGEQSPLCMVGMPSGLVRYDVDKLKRNMTDHADYLTEELLMKIPEILGDPMAISEYSAENTISVFGNIFVSNSPMMIGVTISKDRAGNQISKVRTYNTRRDVGALINDKTILYLGEDKKRTLQWFQACGIQVPLGGTKFGFIRSISQKKQTVNTSFENHLKKPDDQVKQSRKPKAKKPANEHAFDDAVARTEERDASSDGKVAEGNISSAEKVADDAATRANEEKVQVSEGEAQKEASAKEASKKKIADNSALLEREIERRLTRELRDAKTKEAKTAIALRLADVITREGAVLDAASEVSLTEAREVIESMKGYVQKTDVSAVQEEIKATIGKDSRGLFSRWSKKDGVPIAKIRKKIGGEHGQVVRDMSDAQFLMWMDEEYVEARAVVDGAVDKVLGADKRSTDTEASSLLQTVADEILARFDKSGELSEVARIREFYEAQKAKYVSEAEQSRRYSKAYGETMTLLERVREWKIGRFQSSTRPEHRDIFAQTIGQIAKLNVNGRLTNPDRLRRLVGALGEWYTAENMERMGFIARKDDGTYDGATGFNREISDYIKEIADGDGAVTAAELENLNRVIRFMKHMAENYQKVRKNGKRVDALPVAQEMVAIQKDAAKLKVGAMDHFFSSWYMRSYADPRMLCRYMDKYREGGFYTEMLNRLTDGLITAKVARMNIEKKIDAAMGGKVDKYLRDLHKRTYRYGGRDIPAAQALSLYLTSRRKQAWAALIENGFYFHEEAKPGQKGSRMEANGLIGAGIKYTQAEAEAKIAELQAELKGQMTEQDDAFVKVIDQIMNNDCRDLKRATDEERMGYSNALEDFYYPIKRGDTAQNVDRNSFFDEMSRVTNASFNKNTEKGARGRLAIESVEDVVNRHVRGVTMYAGLATVIDDYNMLYHLNVDVDAEGKGNHGAPTTVASCAENTWMQGKQYFEKLIADVQEVRTTDSDEVASFIGKLRGKYARAVLSLNFKVCATQLSSLISATTLLDYECVVKGFSDNGQDVFKYSELAELRAYENTVAMAQGVIDEAGDKLMKPIGATDQFVVRRIFVACQHQVAKDQKLKIGTEENKRAAAALLDRVILETQQNALATEKSQAARSTSEFQKMVTMFRADAVKNIGRLLEAMGEISVIKREAKIFGTSIDEARLSAAKHRRNKAAMSLIMVAAFTTALAKAFRWALKREEEDEWTWKNTLAELFGNFLGGLPLISDAYERLFGSGYGMEDMSVSALNGVLDSVSGLIDVAGQVASGDLDERLLARDLRQMVFSLGQVTGMPTQNVYKYARAIVHRVSPETGYKMDDAFYKSSYRADMADAIASEDEAQLETIIGVMLNENVGRVTSESVRVELGRLMLAGEDALPRSVPEVITVGDDSVKLTARQRKKFESIYGEANAAVEKMIGRRQYGDVDDAVRAKAIKQVYGIYYNRAVEELLGVELEAKNVLFAEAFDPGDLALIVAACGEIRADVGADGKAISGSRKEKVIKYVESLKLRAAQKYMIMGYLGYRNTTGRQVVFSYIESLRISKAKKEALFEMSGYEG